MADDAGQPNDEDGKKSLDRLEKKLIQTHPHLFNGIPREKRQEIIRSLVVTLHKRHSGPLPDIETLDGYSKLIPEGADRVMRMAEKQSDHRMRMEEMVIGKNFRIMASGHYSYRRISTGFLNPARMV